MAKPPKNLRPVNAKQLELALKSTVPESSSGLIDVIVMDVSVPFDKMVTRQGGEIKKLKT